MEAVGVSRILGFSLRHAFLIKDGTVIWRDKKASTSEQVADVLRVLKKLK